MHGTQITQTNVICVPSFFLKKYAPPSCISDYIAYLCGCELYLLTP